MQCRTFLQKLITRKVCKLDKSKITRKEKSGRRFWTKSSKLFQNRILHLIQLKTRT